MPKVKNTRLPDQPPYFRPSFSASAKAIDELSLGYTPVQSIRISSNTEAINALNKYHLYLREYCKFTCAEITEMATALDGLRNITAVYLYYEMLRERGLSNADIVAEVLKPEGHHQLFSVITANVLDVQKSQDILKGNPVSPHERKKITDVLFKAWINRADRIRPFFSVSDSLEVEGLPPEEAPAPEEDLDLLQLPERSLDDLKNDVAKLGFTPAEVSKISKRWGGSRNLRAVLTYCDQLKNTYGFTHEQIIQIVSHSGGSRNLWAVIQLYDQLTKRFSFDREQIVRMVSHNGGSRNLWAAITYYERLRNTYGFTPDQIIRIVSHNGGSPNVNAVLTYYERLKRDFKFDTDEIVRMVSHGGGSQNLLAVIEHYEQLIQFEFTREQITQMVSHIGGSRNLVAVIEHYDQLTNKFHFDYTQITNMVSRYGGGITLAALCECYESLTAFGFTSVELVQIILSHPAGGGKIIRAINLYFYRLMTEGLDIQKITELASRRGSAGRAELMSYIERAPNVDQPANEMLYDFPEYVSVSDLLGLGEDADASYHDLPDAPASSSSALQIS